MAPRTRTIAQSTQGQLLCGSASLSWTLSSPPTAPTNLALIAHPYGRLGGSQHDPVVQALANRLIEDGWAVCTYDARGVGASTGSPTFTGTAEVEDYQAIVQRVLLPLLPDPLPPDSKPQLLLSGYSYGSLAASSCLPPASYSTIRTRHLLISYPLSYLWALTLWRSSTFASTLRNIVASDNADVMAIMGHEDQFTGIETFRKWKEALEKDGGVAGRFRGVEVEGADHFWRGESLGKFLKEVEGWLGIALSVDVP
ncbi:uncharacterized protein P7C70_g597, partial [Phenoliferia sp. Uapishka_3]